VVGGQTYHATHTAHPVPLNEVYKCKFLLKGSEIVGDTEKHVGV